MRASSLLRGSRDLTLLMFCSSAIYLRLGTKNCVVPAITRVASTALVPGPSLRLTILLVRHSSASNGVVWCLSNRNTRLKARTQCTTA
jgi:hypothetical protein